MFIAVPSFLVPQTLVLSIFLLYLRLLLFVWKWVCLICIENRKKATNWPVARIAFVAKQIVNLWRVTIISYFIWEEKVKITGTVQWWNHVTNLNLVLTVLSHSEWVVLLSEILVYVGLGFYILSQSVKSNGRK